MNILRIASYYMTNMWKMSCAMSSCPLLSWFAFCLLFLPTSLSVSVVGMGFLPAWECSPIISEAEEYSKLLCTAATRPVLSTCAVLQPPTKCYSFGQCALVFRVVRLVLRGRDGVPDSAVPPRSALESETFARHLVQIPSFGDGNVPPPLWSVFQC